MPKMFEYLVIKSKDGNNFDSSFIKVKTQWQDTYQITTPVFQVNFSWSDSITHDTSLTSTALSWTCLPWTFLEKRVFEEP